MNAQTVTALMRQFGIQRIYMAPDGEGFSVSLYASEGNPIYSTGTSVGEAYADAERCRERRAVA